MRITSEQVDLVLEKRGLYVFTGDCNQLKKDINKEFISKSGETYKIEFELNEVDFKNTKDGLERELRKVASKISAKEEYILEAMKYFECIFEKGLSIVIVKGEDMYDHHQFRYLIIAGILYLVTRVEILFLMVTNDAVLLGVLDGLMMRKKLMKYVTMFDIEDGVFMEERRIKKPFEETSRMLKLSS